jgi:hypothetical protein
MSDSFNLIYSYTRSQAIEEGVLVDVTNMAKEAGIKYPVALTERLYHELIVPPLELAKQGQSIEGRLWDTFMLFRYAASCANSNAIYFHVTFQTANTIHGEPVRHCARLKALCHGGDDLEPVITIMFPEED